MAECRVKRRDATADFLRVIEPKLQAGELAAAAVEQHIIEIVTADSMCQSERQPVLISPSRNNTRETEAVVWLSPVERQPKPLLSMVLR